MVKTIKELKDDKLISEKEELELILKEKLINELIKLRLHR